MFNINTICNIHYCSQIILNIRYKYPCEYRKTLGIINKIKCIENKIYSLMETCIVE